MAIRPVVPIRGTPRPAPVNRPGGLGRTGRPPAQNGPGPAGRGPSGGVQLPPRLPPPPIIPRGGPTPFPRRPALLLLGLAFLAGYFLFNLLNRKPARNTSLTPEGEWISTGNTVDASLQFFWTTSGSFTNRFSCIDGSSIPDSSQAASDAGPVFVNGVAYRVSNRVQTQTTVCTGGATSPGTTLPRIEYRNAAGVVTTLLTVLQNQVVTSASLRQVFTGTLSNVRAVRAGITYPENFQTPGEFAPGTQPLAPEPEADPQTTPDPLIAPAVVPVVVPSAVPGATPVPAPAAVPGGLPGGALVIPTIPQAVNTIRRIFRRSTPGSQPQTITAQGVSTDPTAGPRPTPTGTTFLPGGITLPDQGPRPDLQGIATEVGKLEKKLEVLLSPDEPLSLLQQINRAIDQIENIRFVLDNLFPGEPYTFSGGAYQLTPVCDRDSEGVLLPPRQAAWTGGEGEIVEVRRKVDALAQLIQHHKDLKQPTCGPRGGGPHSNVTVHFESD